VITGATKAKQVEDNAAAGEVSLSADVVAEIGKILEG